MTDTRYSVQHDFSSSAITVSPRIIYIKGNPEWVGDYLAFGDLIEAEMGNEARDFYYEAIHKLLQDREDDGKNYVEDTVASGVSIVVPKACASKKQKKTGGRRLF